MLLWEMWNFCVYVYVLVHLHLCPFACVCVCLCVRACVCPPDGALDTNESSVNSLREQPGEISNTLPLSSSPPCSFLSMLFCSSHFHHLSVHFQTSMHLDLFFCRHLFSLLFYFHFTKPLSALHFCLPSFSISISFPFFLPCPPAPFFLPSNHL